MRVAYLSSEVVPFAKTGGLADVAGALPKELARRGLEVSVFMPAYRAALATGHSIEPTEIATGVRIGGKQVWGRVLRSRLPGGDGDPEVPVYLIEQPDYFDRPELYRERGEDYRDNCERFTFFCRSVLDAIPQLGRPVDIVHCNDWQTGLIPAYLHDEKSRGETVPASLITIHNMAYQGQFWHWDMLLTGLDWKYFNWHQMEFHGKLNFLKTGIVFADAITTVSSQYAREIQSEPLGCGLQDVLRHRSSTLYGILNGIDETQWNPSHDPHLARTYDVSNWKDGKAECKAALREEVGLPMREGVPLIGLIGRLAEQKGWDLVARVMQRWVQHKEAQWVILGTGEAEFHAVLERLAEKYPEQVAACLTFSDPLAHRIEAASDIFVMASRFEPCGLNQLYSLKYGAVPVVRATGGLADTICNADSRTLESGEANGFTFANDSANELDACLQRACDLYRNEPESWAQLVETGMRQDWSWKRSAQAYEQLYTGMLARRGPEPVGIQP